MKIRSHLDSYVTLDTNFCAVTITCVNRHAQLVGEWVDNEGVHIFDVAHLRGKKSFPLAGGVKTSSVHFEEFTYDTKSKTWRIAREYFFKMWHVIKNEEFDSASHPVYFKVTGSASIFGRKVTDLVPKDPGLWEIKRKDPQLFFQICKEARGFNEKKRNFTICKIGKLWEGGFHLIESLVLECGLAVSDSLSETKQERLILARKLLNRVSEMFKAKEIKFVKIKAHNCASWIFEKLQIAEIKTLRPFWSFIVWNPIRYVKINQLTKKEINIRTETRFKKILERNKNSSEHELTDTLILDATKSLFEFKLKWQDFLKNLNELNIQSLENNQAIATPVLRKKKKCPCIIM